MALMRDDTRDVQRLFAHLVETLGRATPGPPRTTFQVSELYQEIIPYRMHRSRLGVDSNEDYEMAILRLLAGEGGYATVEPEEVQTALAEIARHANPDPGAFREYAGATVHLAPGPVAKVLGPERQFAPPPAAATGGGLPDVGAPSLRVPAPPFALDTSGGLPEPVSHGAPASSGHPAITDSSTCRHCGRTLPLHRAVTYCPFCGEHAHALVCKACGGDLEPGWRFCVECGEPLGARGTRGGG